MNIPYISAFIARWAAIVDAKPSTAVATLHIDPHGTMWTVLRGSNGYAATTGVTEVTAPTYEAVTSEVDYLMGAVA
tara:strand:- start:1677 stop:1904 length:228 start_codon:yes stop_codon:yes gene_type:complete